MSAPGTRIGPYEIVAQLGVGGMGEVYRATDSRLKRQVAIKILPAALATDPDRLARFQREAEVLASLNHPHIAAVYGLEEVHATGGGLAGKALVMELVEGPTLADRIAQGPLPVNEALAIAKQIAAALEAAHEQGIVHRDLKPANIKVRDDGTVKVLDFGLAKLADTGTARGAQIDLSNSPTITAAANTGMGVILGTAAYMSPEQARGRVVDKRTDVWAFGAVLYEMLTGARAFDGEDVTEMMASVVKSTPNWAALPADMPPHVVTLIQRCLEKDRNARIGDIAVARFLLSDHAPVGSAPQCRHTACARPLATSAARLVARRRWRVVILLVGGCGIDRRCDRRVSDRVAPRTSAACRTAADGRWHLRISLWARECQDRSARCIRRSRFRLMAGAWSSRARSRERPAVCLVRSIAPKRRRCPVPKAATRRSFLRMARGSVSGHATR